MPDIGWTELLVIGIVALIVVGPNELPGMFRKLGQITGRIRGMARDFQRAMDEAADEAGVTELNRDLKAAAKYTSNPRKAGMDALKDAVGDINLDEYEEGSETRRMAEEKRAYQQKVREEAVARQKAREEAKAAEAPSGGLDATTAAPAPEPTPAEPTPAPMTDKP